MVSSMASSSTWSSPSSMTMLRAAWASLSGSSMFVSTAMPSDGRSRGAVMLAGRPSTVSDAMGAGRFPVSASRTSSTPELREPVKPRTSPRFSWKEIGSLVHSRSTTSITMSAVALARRGVISMTDPNIASVSWSTVVVAESKISSTWPSRSTATRWHSRSASSS